MALAATLSLLPVRAHSGTNTLNEVRMLIRAGKFSEAEQEGRVLLHETEQRQGAQSLAVAEILDELSEAMRRGGKGGNPETREFCERAIRIKEKALGHEAPGYAASLHQLGFLLYVNGNYEKAKPLLERALKIREEKLGRNHPEVAASLIPLAGLVSDLGNQASAESLFQRALVIREAAFGTESPEVAECLEALATNQFRAGDFAGAIPLHEHALHIWERTLGRDHPKVATCLNNLAAVLDETGDYDGALSSGERALQIRIKNLGRDHELVATSLANSGNYLAAKGNLPKALERYKEALEIRKARFGAESPEVGRVLTRIGILYLQQRQYLKARPILERATMDLEKGLGPDHPDLADALAALATTSAAVGDTMLARRMVERAIRIREKSLGPAHPDVGLLLTQYARLLAGSGQTSAAVEMALRAEEISREHLRLTSRSLAERQALEYAGARPVGVRVAVSALMSSSKPSPEITGRVWDSLIRSRMVVLDEMALRNRAISQAGDHESRRLAQQLSVARRRLANLLVAGPAGDTPERYRATVDRMRQETERVERALASRNSEFRRQKERTKIGLREVASSLPRNCALVAYTLAGDSSRLSYTAFVLAGRGESPRVLRIGPASGIDARVSGWLADVTRSGSRGISVPASARASLDSGVSLRRAIWDPIAPYVSTAKRVFIIPEGAINLVSFAALPSGRDRYLVEGPTVFHYLSAERDLVSGSLPATHGVGLLALGDPAFDQGRGSSPDSKVTRAAASRADSVASRGALPDCGSFYALRFRRLPRSGREAREIARIWGDRGHTVLLTGAEASEGAFKSKAPGKRILHIATHGFFIDENCEIGSGRGRGIGGLVGARVTGKRRMRLGENPLLLSGLALAGANQRASRKPDREDGILTAEEIATLNLSGVEWAVLSACDTGKGRVQAGEGVMGLRRALQVAGASTIIMSLWAVDDESAESWMKALYEGRSVGRLDTADAVARASLTVLRERRAQSRSTAPFYWAAFVAAGDWR
jgi:CHAT domain-containing protein/tetratricopeptide (TPR) repeat protein